MSIAAGIAASGGLIGNDNEVICEDGNALTCSGFVPIGIMLLAISVGLMIAIVVCKKCQKVKRAVRR